MLYMVIERFKHQDVPAIGERFQRQGRMLPEGLLYHASWMDPAAPRCFQLMETADPALLQQWIARWADLVEYGGNRAGRGGLLPRGLQRVERLETTG